ncbi:MAG: helix-turn-helix transcriptional regulator [Sandaracinus sp.]|nr:helix-turn-helix transcriptional regulator [Sandaracinus sp.]MCB9625001.1 helix-turn-helix transcriptional regulator [Sandaracinus sp.]MCB9633850.1 helix-turn-helix transcriptional regulator [Sandaracinus sp.]
MPQTRRDAEALDPALPESSGVHVSRRSSEPDRTELRALSPEVAQLVDAHEALQRRYADLLASAEALATLLDRVPWGLAVVRDQRLVATNAEARRLLESSALHHGLDGTLTSRDEPVRQSLYEIFDRIRSGDAELLGLSVPGPRRPIHLTVLANRPSDGSLLVVLVDPNRPVGCTPETYAQLYGLTQGEARVAHQLVLGRSPRDAAAELGIGVETVRTHVKNILPKVGCHRQVELVRRLVTGAGALTR